MQVTPIGLTHEVASDRAPSALHLMSLVATEAEALITVVGFSWWLTDGSGNWHVATAGEPWTFGDGTQAFRLRLTPPLTVIPDTAELVLTGPSTRARVRFPVPR